MEIQRLATNKTKAPQILAPPNLETLHGAGKLEIWVQSGKILRFCIIVGRMEVVMCLARKIEISLNKK
jgi:hypothetical protein